MNRIKDVSTVMRSHQASRKMHDNNNQTDSKESVGSDSALLSRVTLLLAFLLTAAIYVRCGSFEFSNSDDPIYVTGNPAFTKMLSWELVVNQFVQPLNGMWHPLTTLSFLAEYQLWGERPAGYHITNALLHLLNGFIFHSLLRKLGANHFGRSIATATFLLHPIYAESIAWVAERKSLLCMLCSLECLLSWVHYRSNDKRIYYCKAILLGVLAVMSKSTAMILPVWIACLDMLLFLPSNIHLNARRLRVMFFEYLPFLAIALISAGAAYGTQAAEGAIQHKAPISFRIVNMGLSYWMIASNYLFPFSLSTHYPRPWEWTTVQVWISVTTLVIIAFSLFKLFVKNKIFAIGVLWTVFTLIPTSGIIPHGPHYVAMRYAYLSSLGILISSALVLSKWSSKTESRNVSTVNFVLICALPAFGLITYSFTNYWRSPEAIWKRSLQICGESSFALVNLGSAVAASNPEIAVGYFRSALLRTPDAVVPLQNLALCYEAAGRTNKSIAVLKYGARFSDDRARFCVFLGRAYRIRKEWLESVKWLRESTELERNNPTTHSELSFSLYQAGQTNAALEEALVAQTLSRDKSPQVLAHRIMLLNAVGMTNDIVNLSERLEIANRQYKYNWRYKIQ